MNKSCLFYLLASLAVAGVLSAEVRESRHLSNSIPLAQT